MVLFVLAGLATTRFRGVPSGALWGLLAGIVIAQFVPVPAKTRDPDSP